MAEWHEKVRLILRRMLEATAAGKIVWEHGELPDLYNGSGGGSGFFILFKYPVYVDESSDRDYVEVGIGGCVYRFLIGTEGWSLAVEILAAGLPKWREHLKGLHRGADRELERLDRLLRD